MRIISIETSGPICSVALSVDDSIISELSNTEGNRHDELCAEFVRRLLVDNRITISEIDAIALSSGPGSFTGLRIGASIAKALCFRDNDKDYAPSLISVPTLSAFANFVSDLKTEFTKIIAVIPAQKDYIYYQEFIFKRGLIEDEIKLSTLDDFKKLNFNNTIICGPNIEILTQIPALSYQIEYSAKNIAKLAINKYKTGEFTDADSYKPLYVQEFQVKMKRM